MRRTGSNLLMKERMYLVYYLEKQHQRCFIEIGVLKNFTKFTRKRLCQSLFFNKVAGLWSLYLIQAFRPATFLKRYSRPAILFKKRLWHRCFPVNFVEIFKNTFFTEHLWTNFNDIVLVFLLLTLNIFHTLF